MASPLTDLLNSYPELDVKQKRELWDIYSQSRDIGTLTEKLKLSSAPQRVKAQVWNLKAGKPTTPGFKETPPPEVTLPSSVGREFGGNILASGGRMLQGIATAVTSPVQTAKAIGNLGLGIAESAIPGEQGEEKYARALVDMYKKRYGGWDNFTKSLYEDPVGVLADVATVAGGTGGAAKGLSMAADALKLGKTASVLSDVGEVASTVAGVTDPFRIPGSATKLGMKAAGKVIPSLSPQKIMQSGLERVLTKRDFAKAPELAETALEAETRIHPKGIEKLHGLIENLNETVADMLTEHAEKTIKPEKVAERTGDLLKEYSEGGPRSSVNPEADRAAIAASQQEFLRVHGAQPAGAAGQQIAGFDANGNLVMAPSPAVPSKPMSVVAAQAEKQATYAQLRKKYGELGNASIESQKALARGIKEEIAEAVPEVGALNAKESKFIGLDQAFERAVVRVTNQKLLNVGTSVATLGAKAATGSNKAALVAGFLKAVYESPDLRSRLAIAVNRAQRLNPGKFGPANMATATSRIESYIQSLGPSTPELATLAPTQ